MNKVILAVLFSSFFLYSQENFKNSNKESFIDTTYIKPIKNKIIVKINRDNKIESYSLINNNINLLLVPNFKHKINISLEYDFISFSFSLPNSWTLKNDEKITKGKSSGIDFSFIYYKNHWINKLYYNETVGYYIENTSDFITNWDSTLPYIQLPNAKIKKIGGITSYLLNAKKLSIRALNNQTEIQNKSSGSFIGTFNYEYNYLSNSNEYNKSIQHKYNLLPLLEYQYNWVFLSNKIIIAPKISSGYGYSFVTDINIDKNHSNTFIFALNFNLNINYTYKNVFCGFQYFVNNNFYKEDESKIQNQIRYSNLYFGYKFNTPSIITKYSSKIKNRF